MTWYYILLAVFGVLILMTIGAIIGFQLRKPVKVGTLLVIRDPNDGETYMTLEIKKGMSEHIYNKNEITLEVIERVSKFREKNSDYNAKEVRSYD